MNSKTNSGRGALGHLSLAAVAYLAGVPMLLVAHAMGLLTWASTVGVVSVMVAANLAMFVMARGPRAHPASDARLAWIQVLIAIGVLMFGIYQFDHDRGFGLVICLVVLSFASFRFSSRQFAIASAIVLAAYAGVINLLMWRKPETVDVYQEGFQWLSLAVMLAFFWRLGARTSELRGRIEPVHAELVEAHAQIERMATRDRSTGLPNRDFFAETLARTIARAQLHQRGLALLVLDIDRFKNVNDTLGHDIGDRVLHEVATRLVSTVRSNDFVARLGGDEFGILLEGFRSIDDLAEVTGKIQAAIRRTLVIDGQPLGLSSSIGISAFPEDGRDSGTLLANADIALYRAKAQGRNRFCFYAAEPNVHSQELLSLGAALARAFEQGEFELHYQPKVSLRKGRITGIEALARWRHPERGLIGPAGFIGLVEENGYIETLDLWALRHACERSSAWREQGLRAPPIAVNLSASQFNDPALPKILAAILAETAADPTSLEIEITETAMMRDPDRAVEIMRQLRAMNVRLAIDDFGMGHSSLSYLKRFRVDQLKIDRAFVQDLPEDHENQAITRAIIAMAHSLRMSVVAEGVERQAQLETLRAQGCDEYQGFLCTAALPEEALLEFLAERTAYRSRPPREAVYAAL